MKYFAVLFSLVLLSISCGGIKICTPADPCDCYTIRDGNLAFVNCNPIPVPTPTPTIPPSPSPSPTIAPTPTPTPSPSNSPSPIPSIPPNDCSQFTPYRQGWSILTASLNGKQICGKPTDKTCGCNGVGCTFTIPLGAVADADSTPRYFGEAPCWKSGKVEPCEYPPNSPCGAKTDWSADPGISLTPESEGYGARIKFLRQGKFRIKACRKGSSSLCTEKFANVQ